MDVKAKKPIDWDDLPLYSKIHWYGRHLDDRFMKYVDKIEAKGVVSSMIGDIVKIVPIEKILTVETLSIDDMPDYPFIIKASHASRWNIIIDDKTSLNINKVRHRLISFGGPFRPTQEKQYANIPPRFFIERLIDGKPAWVYMFRCFHGTPRTATVNDGTQQNSYTPEWLPLEPNEGMPLGHLDRPKRLDDMLDIARRLSKPFEFVRIDLFLDEGGDIYFSEFTFTPKAGLPIFSEETEERLGRFWLNV